ncbi:hypothetical protein ACFQUX_28460 [Pantoea stewartii]
MMAFGGRTLVELVAQVRKSGRGQHRKSDEEVGTFKMMGLLLQLLAQKHPTKSMEAMKSQLFLKFIMTYLY